MAITVKIQYSDDSMWGDEGFEGYDVTASYKKFAELVTEAVREINSAWEVEFDNGIIDRVSVIVDTVDEAAQMDNIRMAAEEAMSLVWQDWGWAIQEN